MPSAASPRSRHTRPQGRSPGPMVLDRRCPPAPERGRAGLACPQVPLLCPERASAVALVETAAKGLLARDPPLRPPSEWKGRWELRAEEHAVHHHTCAVRGRQLGAAAGSVSGTATGMQAGPSCGGAAYVGMSLALGWPGLAALSCSPSFIGATRACLMPWPLCYAPAQPWLTMAAAAPHRTCRC